MNPPVAPSTTEEELDTITEEGDSIHSTTSVAGNGGAAQQQGEEEEEEEDDDDDDDDDEESVEDWSCCADFELSVIHLNDRSKSVRWWSGELFPKILFRTTMNIFIYSSLLLHIFTISWILYFSTFFR